MAEVARGKRFSLRAVGGYSINPRAGRCAGSTGGERFSWAILDMGDCWREVWTSTPAASRGATWAKNRERDARAEFARLEAKYDV